MNSILKSNHPLAIESLYILKTTQQDYINLKPAPFSRKQVVIFSNIFFWILLIAFDSISTSATLTGYFDYCITRTLLHCIPFAILIYPNLYWLYPQFFATQQYSWYTIGAISLLTINLLMRFSIDAMMSSPVHVEMYFPFIYNEELAQKAYNAFVNGGFLDRNGTFSISYYLGITVGSIGIFFVVTPVIIIDEWYQKQQLKLQMLNEQAQAKQKALEYQNIQLALQNTKMRFLKAQTDPHFLINAISGIYNLALLQSDKIDFALLRLSDLMSYLLGKGKESVISLQTEIEFLENYIHFSKVIYLDELNITFENKVSETQKVNIEIPPMLLQPFVENAIKHGDAMDNPEGWIKCALNIENNILYFTVKNTISSKRYKRQIKSHGIGIQNVKERLEVYFPNHHALIFRPSENMYEVNLKVDLNQLVAF